MSPLIKPPESKQNTKLSFLRPKSSDHPCQLMLMSFCWLRYLKIICKACVDFCVIPHRPASRVPAEEAHRSILWIINHCQYGAWKRNKPVVNKEDGEQVKEKDINVNAM